MQIEKFSRELLCALVLVLAPAFASAQVITTVAGNGQISYGGGDGDGGPAIMASFFDVYDVVADRNGNFYVSDTGDNKIRKVSANGTISTIAGKGVSFYGFDGDNGPAINASLAYPSGITIDGAGNLYFTDTGNRRVRKISTDGIISTVAGNGSGQFSGDGGPATSAGLPYPNSVAVDHAGNLYIADLLSTTVRKVDTNGIITTVAGIPNSGGAFIEGALATETYLVDPVDIAVNAQGELFIAESYLHRILKVNLAGNISTVVGNGVGSFSGDGGNALNANLFYPTGIDFDGSGNLFVVDGQNYRVRKVDASGVINTVAGNGSDQFSGDGGPATLAGLPYPRGIDIDDLGNLYTVTYDGRVRKVTAPDATGPVIEPIVEGPQGLNGWYLGQVSVGWNAYDPQSTISSSSGCDITTLPGETAGATLTCTATSAGGTSTASRTIKIDSTGPTLNPVIAPSPPIVNETATAFANATDTLSGVASQSCASVNTASVGAKTVVCVAQDVAGNQRSTTKSYSVFYGFNGFLSPLVELPRTNRIKKGRTLPVSWRMVDGQGNPILNLVSAQAQFVSAAACDGVFQQAITYPPNRYVVGQGHDSPSALQNLGGGVYQLNWLVPREPRYVCGQLLVSFDDGMSYALNLWIE
jgi:sugar lactone lactonase YvrE